MTRAGWIAIIMLVGSAGSAFAGHHHKDKKKPPPADRQPPEPDADADAKPQPPPPPEPPPPSDTDQPWAKGVTEEQKETAQHLLEEGNDLFVQNKHREALAKYQDAVAVWDHPAIRFNMVRALIALERPLEAYDNLEKALAYGNAPLEEQVFTEAQNYQTLLAGQIATVSITCKQDKVEIALDGESFLSCPGAKSQRVLPGTHVVVGKKEGYMASTQDVLLLPGKTEPVDVSLQSIEQATRTRTRWKTWKPWAVAGGGLLFAGLGGLLEAAAVGDMKTYESQVASTCADDGCLPGELPNGFETRALAEDKVAISMIAVGGAVVAVGVTMVIMNRPHTYIPEQNRPMVTPTVSPGGAGVALSGRF